MVQLFAQLLAMLFQPVNLVFHRLIKCFDIFAVKVNQSYQFALLFHHQRFVYKFEIVDHRFNIFGINILAVGSNYHVLFPPFNA